MELSRIFVCCVSAGGCQIGNEFHMSLYAVDTCIMELILVCMKSCHMRNLRSRVLRSTQVLEFGVCSKKK